MSYKWSKNWSVCVVFAIILGGGGTFGNENLSFDDSSTIKYFEKDEDVGGSSRPTVPKCCELDHGFSWRNKSNCVPTEDEFLPEFEDNPEGSREAKDVSLGERYNYFIGDPCFNQKYILDLPSYPYDNYSIYSNGSLLYSEKLYSKEQFCLETLDGLLRVFVCFENDERDVELDATFILYAAALLISIPFLVLTALIYLCIDMLRDLHGKCLACHVLCLAIGYFFLALVQLASAQLDEEICAAAGFVIQFFFVAAFFWLNVICYNTWRCINNDFQCAFKPTNLRSEKITFLCYSLYGWHGPCILTIVSLVMDFTPAIPDSYLKPNFGFRSCWFYSDDAALPYFYGPVGIIIIVNIIFFALSAKKIYSKQQKHVTLMTENSCTEDNTREHCLSIRVYTEALEECIYLFGVMGINWAAELISWAIGGSPNIWLITDLFNAFQGIIIFYLFVVKRFRVRNIVKSKSSSLWRKITKCNWKYEKENKNRISRHWHANIHEEFEESGMNLDPLISRPTAL